MDTVLTRLRQAAPQRLSSPWLVSMQWRDLLFAHWPIKPEQLRRFIPAALEIDTFDGWAWIGIVPFHLTIRFRWMPFSMSFPEVNVRTYVRHGTKTGVWFLSLDADSRLAVTVARDRYRLPYHRAAIKMHRAAAPQACEALGQHRRARFESRRLSHASGSANLVLNYSSIGDPYHASPGSLDHWLVERYRLFALNRRGAIGTADIDHAPWGLQSANAEFGTNTMFEPLGIPGPALAPVLHFARRVDALAWRLRFDV